MYLRQEWYDQRLITNVLTEPVTLNYKHLSRIWVPDVFMPNEKRATFHSITVPNILLRLYPDGKMVYSQRFARVFFNRAHWGYLEIICSQRVACLFQVHSLEVIKNGIQT